MDQSEERQMAAQRISGLGKTLRAFLERPVSKHPKQGFCRRYIASPRLHT